MQWRWFSKNITNTSRWHCTPNHHRLCKLNNGLKATWAMSLSALPPDSRTLVSKWNTKLALIWKEDFGPLGNSPVLLLLSPGKTPLMITVAKFLDTSMFYLFLVWLSTEAVAFFTPRPPFFFPCLLLLSRLIYWETLSARLSKLENYGFDQLVS